MRRINEAVNNHAECCSSLHSDGSCSVKTCESNNQWRCLKYSGLDIRYDIKNKRCYILNEINEDFEKNEII